MSTDMNVVFFSISLFASIIGAVCGIGGGVIMKPVLDAFGILNVSTISFLSSCTVLTMSLYSVGATLFRHENMLEARTATPLAIGAAIGGVVGKEIFNHLSNTLSNPDVVGKVQSTCLLLATALTLIYTMRQSHIVTRHVQSLPLCIAIGWVLGMTSAFLGIGGGPINLMVLSYFFSMDTKKAAQNSLYIIFISQCTSLLTSLLQAHIPTFNPLLLALMILGGLVGAIIGRKANRLVKAETVNKLFCIVMGMIICICAFNIMKAF